MSDVTLIDASGVEVFRGTSTGGGSTVSVATKTLVNAEIRSLVAGVELVPAAPSGSMYFPLSALLIADCGAGAYTNIDAIGGLYVTYDPVPGGVNAQQPILGELDEASSAVSNLLTASDPVIGWMRQIGAGNSLGWCFGDPTSGYDGKPLLLALDNQNSGELTGGNVANTLRVVVYYATVTL